MVKPSYILCAVGVGFLCLVSLSAHARISYEGVKSIVSRATIEVPLLIVHTRAPQKLELILVSESTIVTDRRGLLRDRKFLEITSATGCRWRSAEGPILMKGGRFNVYRWVYNCRNLGRAELLRLNVFRHLKISVAEVALDLFIQTDERLNPRINQGVRSRGRFWKNLHTLKPGFSTVKLER